MTHGTFLITGATGKTGRRVTQLLKERGHTVREGSRSAATPFDWEDRTTWSAALKDVSAVYVVLTSLGGPEGNEQLGAFAKAAAAAGVTKAVMLSFPDGGGMDFSLVADTERQITDAGIALTVLRPRWFHQNFSEDFLFDSVSSGELRLPAGDGKEAFIDADDIAEVAVAALLDDKHAGKSYDLTGPQALSFAQIARELSAATGRSITYVPVTSEQFLAEQEAQGIPTEWAQVLDGLYSGIAAGALNNTSDSVEKVLEKPGREFADYARSAAATGVWAV